MSAPIDLSIDTLLDDDIFLDRRQKQFKEGQRDALKHGLVVEDLKHKASTALTRIDRLGRTKRAEQVLHRMDLGAQAGPDSVKERLDTFEATADPTGKTAPGLTQKEKTARLQRLQDDDRVLDFFERNPQAAALSADDPTLFGTVGSAISSSAGWVWDKGASIYRGGAGHRLTERRGQLGGQLMFGVREGRSIEDLAALRAEKGRIDEEIQKLGLGEGSTLDTLFEGVGQFTTLGFDSAMTGVEVVLDRIPENLVLGAAAGAALTPQAAGAGALLGAPSAVVATAPILFKTGFLANLAEMETGNRYLDLVDHEGWSATDSSTMYNALVYGAASTFIEAYALNLTWKIAGKPLTTLAAPKAAQILGIQTSNYFKNPTRARVFAEAFGAVALGSIPEGVEELLQATVAVEMGNLAGGKISTWEEFLDNVAQGAREGVLASGSVLLTGGLAAPFISYKANRRAKQYETEQEFFDNIEHFKDSSTMAERSPELAGEFVGALTDGTERDTIYVEAEALNQALQEEGIAEAEAERVMPGIRQRIDEAVESGRRVAIPTREFASVVANSNLMPRVRAHISTSQTGRTNAQRQADQKLASEGSPEQDAVVDEQSEYMKLQSELDQSATKVAQTVVEQLVASGRRTPKAAQQEAEIVWARARAFAAQLSEKGGKLFTPEEAFELAPFTVLTREQATARQERQRDLTLQQEQARLDEVVLNQPAVVAAVVRFTDPETGEAREFDGVHHGEALEKAEAAGFDLDDFPDFDAAREQLGLFRTDDGRVITREEASLEFVSDVEGRVAVSEDFPQLNQAGIPQSEPSTVLQENAVAPAEPESPFATPDDSEGRVRRKANRKKDGRKFRSGPGEPVNARKTVTLADGSKVTVGKQRPQDWVERVESVGLTDEQIRDFRNWHYEVSGLFAATFGEDAPLFTAAWLIAQQNASPTAAMNNMLRVREQLLNGLIGKGKKGGVAHDRLVSFWTEALESSGLDDLATLAGSQKLYDFVDSALGKSTRTWMGDDATAGEPAVIDVHTARDAGFLDETYRDRLIALGANPRVLEALTLDLKGAPTEAQYERAAEYLHTIRDYLNENNIFGGGFERVAEVQALGWMALLTQTGQEAASGQDAIDSRTFRISAEAVFGEGAPLNDTLGNITEGLTTSEVTGLTHSVVHSALSQVIPLLGNPPILSALTGVGAWRADLNPSTQLQFIASDEVSADVAHALGYLMQQTEVWSGRELSMTQGGNWPSGATHWFVDVKSAGGELDSDAGRTELFALILRQTGQPLGYSPIDGGFRIYLDRKDDAGKNVDWGIGNAAKAQEALHRKIINPIGDAIGRVSYDVSTEYRPGFVQQARNDWKENPNGEAYLERFAERADVRSKLRDARGSVEETYRAELDRRRGERDQRDGGPVERGREHGANHRRLGLLGDDRAPIALDELHQGTKNTPSAQRAVYRAMGMRVNKRKNTSEGLKIYPLQDVFGETVEEVDAQLTAWLDRIGWSYRVFGPKSGPNGKPLYPDFQDPATESYDQNVAWIFDPSEEDGSFRDHAYTLAWRVTHEIAHGIVNDRLTEKYGGRGRRAGAMGVVIRGPFFKQDTSLTLADAMRAVEWEAETFIEQRRILSEEFGIEISDEQFNLENSINTADAVYRSVSGQFGNPGEMGVSPTNLGPEEVLDRAFDILRTLSREINGDTAETFRQSDIVLNQANSQVRGQFIPQQDGDAAFIALLEAADTSTFQHELAHWYLNQMVVADRLGLGSDQQQTDLATIMSWLEVSTVDQLTQPYADGRLAPNGEVDIPHERFARGFETYLLEGNAPNREMKSSFARYRQWIIQAYGGIKAAARALGITLPEEITEVYDRMFLVDATLDDVTGGFDQPLLATLGPEDVGFTGENDPAWRRYLRDWEDHQEASFQQVYRAKVLEVEARKREQRAEMTEQFRAEAEAEVQDDPGWQVIRFIKRGVMPDGSVVEGSIPGMDRFALREIFGDRAERLIEILIGLENQGSGRRLVAGENVEGIDPDWLVETFEFNSVPEMVDAILQARTVEQHVQERVNREIEASDDFTEAAVEEEAEAAAAADREALYAAELRRLRQLASGEIQAAARRATADTGAPAASETRERLEAARSRLEGLDPNLAPEQERADAVSAAAAARAQATAEAEGRRAQNAAARTVAEIEARLQTGQIKARAIELVQTVKTEDLKRERSGWQRITVREGKKARRLLAKRDYAAAAVAVERQLLAHYASVEATRMIDAVDKGHRDVARITRKKNLDRLHAPGFDGAAQIRRLVQQFDLRKQRPKLDPKSAQEENVRQRRIQRLLNSGGVAERFESLLDFQAKVIAQYKVLDIPDWLSTNEQEQTPRHWRDLTAFEFLELVDTIKNINHISKAEVKDIRTNKAIATEEAANLVADRIRASNKLRKKSKFHTNPPWHLEALKSKWRKFDSWMLAPEFFVDFLGGDDFVSNAVRTYVWEPIQLGAEKYRRLQLSVIKPFNEIINGLDYGRMKKIHHVPELGEVSGIRHYEIFMMGLHTGTESNRFRLYEGFKNARDRRWSEQGINTALELLNDSEWAAIQAIWDVMEDLRADVWKHHFEQTGITPKALERREFVTPTGREMQGGYMPAKYDRRLSDRQRKLQEKADVEGLHGHSYAKTEIDHGHTQGRIEGFSAPLDLDPLVIPRHLDQVVYDIAMRGAVKDAHAILNHASVRNAVVDTFGREYVSLLDNWIFEISNRGSENAPESDGWQSARQTSDWVRRGVVVSGLGYRMSTGILQLTGLLPIFFEVGPTYTMRALAKFTARGGYFAIRDTKEMSEALRSRGLTKDRELREMLGALKGDDSISAKARANLGLFIVAGDSIVSTIAWEAQYQKSLDLGNSHEIAVRDGDRAIRKTQGSGDVQDLSQIMRAKGFDRWLVLFGSFASNLYGRERRAGRIAVGLQSTKDLYGKPVRKANPALALALLTTSVYMPAVLEAYIRGQGPDEEDEFANDPLRWLYWSGKQTVSFAMMPLPLVSDAVDKLLFPERGFAGRTPTTRLLEAPIDIGNEAWKAFADDEEFSVEAISRAVLTGVTLFKQVPLSQPEIWVDNFAEGFDDAEPRDFIWRKPRERR